MSKVAVTSGTSIQKVIEHPDQQIFPVVEKDSHRYLGYIRYEDAKRSLTDVSTCGDLLRLSDPRGMTGAIYADPHESPAQALKKIATYKLDFLPVVDHQGRYTGTVDIKGLSELLETEA